MVKIVFTALSGPHGGPLPRFFTRCGWRGWKNLPKDQPVLLCANHSSAVDPILLICAMRQDFPLRIMAKKQLMKIPVVGAFLRAIGVFGVDRGNSDIAAVKTSIQSLRDGWNLLVFPEGTRVKEPGSVDVKGGVGMMAIRSGVPLVPVFIGRTSACFTGCPSSSESPTTRYIPVGRERRRSISPTPRRSCVGPMRWEGSNGRGKSSQKRRFLLRRGAGCEAGGGDSP